MNKFRKPHGGGGFGDRGGAPHHAAQSGEKFDAICAQCGKPCQVPFRPNGKKPVFCSNCFNEQRQGGGAPQGAGQGTFNKESFPRRDSFPANSFQPRSGVPYGAPRSDAPFNAPRPDDRAILDLKRQIDVVASKVDVILKILEASRKPEQSSAKPQAVAPVPVVKSVVAPVAPVVPVKKMLTPAGKELVKKKTAKKGKKLLGK
jgi:CxxC-x17-CxxC domain-containing protein